MFCSHELKMSIVSRASEKVQRNVQQCDSHGWHHKSARLDFSNWITVLVTHKPFFCWYFVIKWSTSTVLMVTLQSLLRLTIVALGVVIVSAEWLVDERCMNLTHRALSLQQQSENAVVDDDSDTNAPVTFGPNRQLRGDRFHRQLQEQVAFKMKMFWREGYCWQVSVGNSRCLLF